MWLRLINSYNKILYIKVPTTRAGFNRGSTIPKYLPTQKKNLYMTGK